MFKHYLFNYKFIPKSLGTIQHYGSEETGWEQSFIMMRASHFHSQKSCKNSAIPANMPFT